MKYNFENNPQQVGMLRESLRRYLREETHSSFGYGSIAKSAGLKVSQRSSIQRFCDKDDGELKFETAEKLWVFLIEKAPNFILNETSAHASAADADFGLALQSFLELDIGLQRNFLGKFAGEYLLLRESWMDSAAGVQGEYIVVGHLFLDFKESGVLNSYSRTEVKKDDGNLSVTEFEGKAYYNRGKFVIVCKNSNDDLTIFSFHIHRPHEPQKESVDQMFGNLFTVIGGEDNNRTFRVSASRVKNIEMHKIGIYKENSIELSKFKEEEKYIIYAGNEK